MSKNAVHSTGKKILFSNATAAALSLCLFNTKEIKADNLTSQEIQEGSNSNRVDNISKNEGGGVPQPLFSQMMHLQRTLRLAMTKKLQQVQIQIMRIGQLSKSLLIVRPAKG